MKVAPPSSAFVRWVGLSLSMLLWAQSALAHTQKGEAAGFLSAFVIPSRVWTSAGNGRCRPLGAPLSAPRGVAFAVAFPLVMAMGGCSGSSAYHYPVLYGIAASAILFGSAVMFEIRPPGGGRRRRSILCYLPWARTRHRTPTGPKCLLSAWASSLRRGVSTVGIGVGAVHRWVSGRRLCGLPLLSLRSGGVFFMWKRSRERSVFGVLCLARFRHVSPHGGSSSDFHGHGPALRQPHPLFDEPGGLRACAGFSSLSGPSWDSLRTTCAVHASCGVAVWRAYRNRCNR